MTTALQEMTESPSADQESPESQPEAATTSSPQASSSTSSSLTMSTGSSEDAESVVEPQSPAKRSVSRLSGPTNQASSKQNSVRAQQKQQQQPMLLNAQLIDKLMSNKTLVGLMSSQLKRVIDTERMSDLEKQRIVRQVFDQMMEEKVDFSMNNVRLAVKTVSSSYRAAAEKQRRRSASGSEPAKVKQMAAPAANRQAAAGKIDLKGFGRRAGATDQQPRQQPQQPKKRAEEQSTTTSKSFPVIDTALKLTKSGRSQSGGGSSSSASSSSSSSSSSSPTSAGRSGEQPKTDASGNPIVVVLLPQEKA